MPHDRSIDPLYVIFEQHLFNFQDADLDRQTFVSNVLKDYFSYLRKANISIPKPLESSIMEELESQVQAMLVKKIYGCFSIQEYQDGLTPTLKNGAGSRYKNLNKKSE